MSENFAYLLPYRGLIGVSGLDRHVFLQGLISNDINMCKPGQPIYATLLTPQGKFLHDMFIVDGGDRFFIDCEAARADDLLTRLQKYKLRAKVAFENLMGAYDIWAVPITSSHSTQLDKSLFYTDPRLPALGQRVILEKNAKSDIQSADVSFYDKHRLILGIPDGSRDMLVEKSTLLECNMDQLNAISWSKGCYIGQELTARMYHRALVKKRLFPVKIEGQLPLPGAFLYLEGEEIGEMRSSSDGVGLALLNIAKAKISIKESKIFTCAGAQITCSVPDWLNLSEDSV